jgi:hypothetical protein
MNEKRTWQPETAKPHITTIDRIGAVFHIGRTEDFMFAGWNELGLLNIETEFGNLSQSAQEIFNRNSQTERPIAFLQTWHITPVEFHLTEAPYNVPDEPGEVAQDLLIYTVGDKKGKEQPLRVLELEILQAIVERSYVWQEFRTPDIKLNDAPIEAQPMYSILLEPSESTNNESVIMLFKSRIPNTTNEPAYKRFIVETLKALTSLDVVQDGKARKGYVRALMGQIDPNSDTGGLAYNLLRPIGLFMNFPKEKWDQLRLDSSGRNLVQQIYLIGRELGFVDEDVLKRTNYLNVKIDDLDVNELREIVKIVYRTVKNSF